MILNNALLTAVETLIETSKASLRSLALSLGPDVDFVRRKCLLRRSMLFSLMIVMMVGGFSEHGALEMQTADHPDTVYPISLHRVRAPRLSPDLHGHPHMRGAKSPPLRVPRRALVHADHGPLAHAGRRAADASVATSAGSLLPSGACEVEPLAPDDRVGRCLREVAFRRGRCVQTPSRRSASTIQGQEVVVSSWGERRF